MIEKVRNRIQSLKGRKLYFKYRGSRNQIEEFVGYVDCIYPNVFTIRLIDNGIIKSYSYNDVLIHKLVFKSA